MQEYVEDKFPKIVDLCWNDDSSSEKVLKSRPKRRYSVAGTPASLPMPDSAVSSAEDMTLEMLRALAGYANKSSV
jgi:hypothetical protein